MNEEKQGLGPESHESVPDPNDWGLIINPFVYGVASVLILILIAMGIIMPDRMETVVTNIQAFLAEYFGWFYIMTVAGILGFVIWLAFSRFGSIVLGPNDSEPAYNYFTWFTMLFSAGMGIGLLFYSVAEPLTHFSAPPILPHGYTREAAQQSFNLTYFHWGIHPWAVYCLVGVTLAYFGFRRGQPLTIRSAFYPLLGERVHGTAGNIIDVVAVVSTLFGVATSLGLGVIQVNRGLSYAFADYGFELSVGPGVQIILIALITAGATISVVLGLDVGIRRLSEWNISVAVVMAIVLLLIGPTLFIFNIFVQNLGYYVQNIIETTMWTATYQDKEWLSDWTIFYWAWWIAWSPFVGMFIARISRGRTIREFIAGAMLAPTLATFAWMSIFGGSAIYVEMFGDPEIGLGEQVVQDVDVALFALFEQFPFHQVTWIIAIVLIIGFFITSSDSASMVVSILTAGGHPEPPTVQRVYWAVLEGSVAAILLWVGGLAALQTGAITTGLPLAIVLVLMTVSLYKGLKQERAVRLVPMFTPPEESYLSSTATDEDTTSSDDEEDEPR